MSAQVDEPIRFLPLEVGNTWHFALNTPLYTTVTVTGTTVVNDTTYFVLDDEYFLFGDTLRTDTNGNIWARNEGRDVLLFAFDHVPGEWYEVPEPFSFSTKPYRVEIERLSEYSVGSQTFSDVVVLFFNIVQARDAETWLYFTPNLGLIHRQEIWGEYSLSWARVGGEVTTVSVESTDDPEVLSEVDVYPNPFRTEATITVPVGRAGNPVLRLTNPLGRVVAKQSPDSCSLHNCTFSVQGSQLVDGVYIVHVTSATYSMVRNVVHIE